MKNHFFTLFLIAFSINLPAQTLCGTVNENQTLTLTAPVGNVFISVTFASYGTPNGSCGSFTIGGCHASNSQSIVQSYLIGNNSGSIPATNGTFGDPCGGTFKRLYVEAVYSTILPLKILSFSGSAQGTINFLQWQTTNEINAKQFEIERSDDGTNFSRKEIIMANNRTGINNYTFSDRVSQTGIYFYRLKMIDLDGKFIYSNTIKLSAHGDDQLLVFPNPVTDLLTLSGLHNGGTIEILNMQGVSLRHINITAQSQSINISDYPGGIYLVKYVHDHTTMFQKIVKR